MEEEFQLKGLVEKGDKYIFSKIRFSLSRQRSTLTERMLAISRSKLRAYFNFTGVISKSLI